MFRSILVANRGEIACRVIRACRELGIESIAVYSEEDSGSPHVKSADRAYALGGQSATESYLDAGKILAAAAATHAEAIHPGYGFLSENPDFVDMCRRARVTFIGPSPQIMKTMGDKLAGRAFATKADVPLLPGSDEPLDPKKAKPVAASIGYPVLVKAAAGGGGMGIRIVRTSDELANAVKETVFAGSQYFGDGRVFIEKYLPDASHVEVQVVGDGKSGFVHLFERDCSVQRRNQKLVEETPCSIKLSPSLLQPIWAAAVRLARSAKYCGVGTIEFLADPEGNFFFIEMNTRIQVEHPITEETTGLDLVEMQIRVAAGEPLELQQEHISREGHAIEARVLSEDPETMLPCPGTITVYEEPNGEGVRVDSGVAEGTLVSGFYDPLMAKVTAYGAHREEARIRLIKALQSFHIEGVLTNIPFLLRIVSSDEFVSGHYDTGIVKRLTKSEKMTPSLKRVATIVAALAFDEDSTTDAKLESGLMMSTHQRGEAWWRCWIARQHMRRGPSYFRWRNE